VDRRASPEAELFSVFLLARSLEVGGTERQLVELAKGLRERGHEVRVGTFYSRGPLAGELAGAGVEIVDLRKSGRWDVLPFLATGIAALRRYRPDVIYSFLGGPNVVAALIRRFVPRAALVWSVRNSSIDMSVDNAAARLGFRLEAALAQGPDAIIANSSAGRTFAIGRGFPERKIFVVPNGIDTERFRRDEAVRAKQRRALRLRKDEIAVGVLGRLNATKDYPTFLRAAAVLARDMPKLRFLCVGSGQELARLERLAGELGIGERVLFTGELDPVAALNAFDIACSPSVTEGFSNSIAEAMACGLRCVVTDAGDSASIVGEFGTVVPTSSPELLAEALRAEIGRLPAHDPAEPRARIIDKYSIPAMVDRTLEIFRRARMSAEGSRRAAAAPAAV
jgi:glycosyltransferase involved in cell wall biosynthesis